MNAQEQWKDEYKTFRAFRKLDIKTLHEWNRSDMLKIRRAAALERKLEAAQRKIEAQEKQLDALGRAYDAMRDTVMDLTL